MASILGIFASSVLPILLIISVGYLLDRVQDIHVESFNALTLYVLTPALIFHSIALTELGASAILKVTVGVVVFLIIIVGVSVGYGLGVGKSESLLSAFVLIAVFGNTGGLGIPVADFAFGDIGRQTAVLFGAIHGAFVFTVGLYIASNSKNGATSSLVRILRYPLIYAVVAAIGARAVGVVPAADSIAMQTIGLLGDSAIPMMLIILGIQLSQTEYRKAVSMTKTPILFRFGVSPVIGYLVVIGLNFQQATVAQVFILLTAMPVAIAPVIFVVEFANDMEVGGVSMPEFVSANVFVTTVLSIPVITVLIILLKSGVVV